MGPGLAHSLSEHAEQEGLLSAIRVAEDWRDALEDMAEQANEEQRPAAIHLLNAIRMWLSMNVPKDHTHA